MSIEKCIICRDKDLKSYASEEHIFPNCIGGRIKTYLVCEECNSKLGTKIDAEFTEQPLIKALRNKHRIKNRDGIVPSITTKDFGWKDENGEPVVITHNGILEPPKVDIKKSNNKIEVKFSGSDKDAIIKSLNREAKKQGGNIIINEKDDSPKKAQVDIEYHKLTSVMNYNETKMRNLCLKIAFEIACEKYGISYLKDRIGIQIQRDLYNLIYCGTPIEYSKYSIQNIKLSIDKTSSQHIWNLLEVDNMSVALILLFNVFFCAIMISDNTNNLTK